MKVLKNHITFFFKSDNSFKHVSIIAGGAIIAQGFSVFIMPFLSRIYSPEDFGVLAIFSSVMSIAMQLTFLNYHFGIALPKSNRYCNAIVYLCLIIHIFFSIIFTVFIFTIGDFVFIKLSMNSLIKYKALLPIAVFCAGGYAALTQWAIRERAFSSISKTKITQSILGGLVKITLGLLSMKPVGLLIGTIIGQASGITSLLKSILKVQGFPKTSIKDIKRCAIKYRKFPMYDTWACMLNTITAQITPILIVSFFGTMQAGYFSIAQQLLQIPMVFIGQAIGQVFLQKASRAKYDGGIKDLTFTTYNVLVAGGLFPLLLLSFLAPQIFAFVLGEEWYEAGKMARLLGPLIALTFVFSPISHIFNIFNKQELSLLLEITYAAFHILTFCITAHYLKNILYTVASISAMGFILVTFRLIILLRTAGISFYKSIKNFIINIIFNVALISPAWYFDYIHASTKATIIVLFIIILIYLTTLIRLIKFNFKHFYCSKI